MSTVLGLASSSASPLHYGSLERTSSSWSKVAEKRSAMEATIATPSQMQRSSFHEEGKLEYEPPTTERTVRASGDIPGASNEALETAFQDRDEHDGGGSPPNRYPHAAAETLRQRRRRAAMEFHYQMMEDQYYDHTRSLPSRQKEPKFKKDRLRPSYKRAPSSSSLTVAGGILGDIAGPLTPTTPVDDTEPLLSKHIPFWMPMDSFSGPPLIMPRERKHTDVHIYGAGCGDVYHRVKNANVGGRQGQNSVRNGHHDGHHDVEAQRLLGIPNQPHPSHDMHNNPNVARENALLVFLFVLMAFTGISFFVDLDVLLALLKMLNGKGSA